MREVVILTVGAEWNSPYEMYAHSAVARTVGLSGPAIQALTSGEASTDLSNDEQIAQRFTRQLTRDRRIDADLYAEARAPS